MGTVLVMLVRQPEPQWLERGQPVLALAPAAQTCLHGAPQLPAERQARLETHLEAALVAQHRLVQQSRRLTQGKALAHGKLVNADDPTSAPMCQGNSNGPAPFGRKPGLIAEPAAGFSFAWPLPVGHPSAVR
jgi:hypothetical protein